MDRSFEHTVLAYLDGLLDKREEREFLKEVSRSTEKRAVLEQYRKLDRTLRNKSVPLAVPLKVQRALADQIPALTEILPPAAGSAVIAAGSSRIGVLAKSASFFSRKIISLLIIGGATVSLVTTLVITGSFSELENSEQLVVGTSNPAAESVDASGDESGQDVVDPAYGSRTSTAAVDAAGPGNSTVDRDLNTSRRSAVSSRDTQPQDRLTARSAASRAEDAVRRQSAFSPSTGMDPGVAPNVTWESTENSAGTAPFAHDRDAGIAFIPLTADPVFSPESRGIRDYPPQPKSLGELLGGSVYAYLETGAADVRSTGGQTSASSFGGVYLLGLRAELSPHFAAGAELGQSTFAREALVSKTAALSPESGTQVIIIDNAIESSAQSWLRLHGLYTLNPASRLRFQADLGTGVLLTRERPVMWTAGVSSLYALTYALHLRAGLHYSGAWMKPVATVPVINTTNTGVIGIIRRAENAGTIYSSSIEFRFGFGVLLW